MKMRYMVILSLLFGALFCVNPAAGQEALSQDEIAKMPHITAMQAYVLSRQNKILLLDVHDGSDRSKILGAYYIPSQKIKDVTLKIPKTQLIGVFCD
jgi:hypothetical protein